MGTDRHRTPLPELPSLEAGVTLLETDRHTSGALQSLVLDHVLTAGGTARWVDSHGRATTTSLARLAPSGRVLDQIAVARGFTAYQHHSLVKTLQTQLAAGDTVVSLVVAPSVDWHYRADDLHRAQADAMFASTVDRLETIAASHEIPVLVTRERTDSVAEPLDTITETTITCERTRFGPRFVADEFETLVYPAGNGTVQTTLAFWERVLADRTALAVDESTEQGVTAVGAY